MINYSVLKQCCTKPKESILKGKDYQYIRRGSTVLGVCHLDTALDVDIFAADTANHYVFSPSLDDRLGLYILSHALPGRGINLDMLLTDGEESGSSTALLFETSVQYNWIVEFDRRGTDAVLYQYDVDPWRSALEKYFTIGHGTLSDISYLDNLGTCAANIGIGYHNEHTLSCYANLKHSMKQVERFIEFYNVYRDVSFPFTAPRWNTRKFDIAPSKNPQPCSNRCDICGKAPYAQTNGLTLCYSCFTAFY